MRLPFHQQMSADHTTVIDNWILLSCGKNELHVANIPNSKFSIRVTITVFCQWMCAKWLCVHMNKHKNVICNQIVMILGYVFCKIEFSVQPTIFLSVGIVPPITYTSTIRSIDIIFLFLKAVAERK